EREAIGDRTDQSAVDVNGRSRHACEYECAFRIGAAQTSDDHVLLGADPIRHNAQDLDLKLLTLVAVEHRTSRAMQPFTDLGDRKDPGTRSSRRDLLILSGPRI